MTMPLLIDDASKLWHRLWSVRLSLAAAGLGALSEALPYIAPEHASLHFAGLTGAVSLAAGVARLVAQPKTRGRRG
jgi:hypothetical protein